jgi:hypothetical protein
MLMPFGKHRGQSLDELPTAYITWLAGKLDEWHPPLRAAVIAEQERRATAAPPSASLPTSAPPTITPALVIEAGARALTAQYAGHAETQRHVRACAVLLRTLLADADTRRPDVIGAPHPEVPF